MAIDIFGLEPNIVPRDLRAYTNLIYGPPKTGKTTAAAQFPKSLLLAFEIGYKALPGVVAAPVKTWSDVKGVLVQLKRPEAKDRYEVIIWDTFGIAYDLAEKFVCNREGVQKISDIPFGGGLRSFFNAI